jgi:uncharacterized glyoxalase superfamily protein PhnB
MRNNRSMPVSVIIPVLYYGDVDVAAAFLSAAFGFRTRLRIGVHRAQLEYAGASLVIVRQETPSSHERGEVMVRVGNADRHHETARANGARIVAPPSDFPYGERQYSAEDIAGHKWVFSQSIANVDPAQWGGELL